MQSRRTHSFQILLTMAAEAVDARSKEYAMVGRELAKAQQTLSTLEQHQQDSRRHFDDRGTTGISITALRNHQNFLAKLDHAIRTQQSRVSSLKDAAAAALRHLGEAERTRLGFTRLQERQASAQRRLDDKREQKQTDEHAANVACRR